MKLKPLDQCFVKKEKRIKVQFKTIPSFLEKKEHCQAVVRQSHQHQAAAGPCGACTGLQPRAALVIGEVVPSGPQNYRVRANLSLRVGL